MRQCRLAALDHWAEQRKLPPAPFARARQAILALYDQASAEEKQGRLHKAENPPGTAGSHA